MVRVRCEGLIIKWDWLTSPGWCCQLSWCHHLITSPPAPHTPHTGGHQSSELWSVVVSWCETFLWSVIKYNDSEAGVRLVVIQRGYTGTWTHSCCWLSWCWWQLLTDSCHSWQLLPPSSDQLSLSAQPSHGSCLCSTIDLRLSLSSHSSPWLVSLASSAPLITLSAVKFKTQKIVGAAVQWWWWVMYCHI